MNQVRLSVRRSVSKSIHQSVCLSVRRSVGQLLSDGKKNLTQCKRAWDISTMDKYYIIYIKKKKKIHTHSEMREM